MPAVGAGFAAGTGSVCEAAHREPPAQFLVYRPQTPQLADLPVLTPLLSVLH